MLRIVILEELGVIIDSNQIKENLYILHDYIYSNLKKDNFKIEKLKSNLYKILNIKMEE